MSNAKPVPVYVGVNRDLPNNAKKVEGNLKELVAQLYERQKIFYRDTNGLMIDGTYSLREHYNVIDSMREFNANDGKPTQESMDLFWGELHPFVDNYSWFRGLGIPTSNGFVVIYEPWIFIDESRHHEIYTLGNVEKKELDEIVGTYVSGLMQTMEKIEKGLAKAKALKRK